MLLTLTHDLVNFAVLLSTDKLLVLIGQLDLDSHLIGHALDKGDLVDDHHRCLNGVVGTIDGKCQLVETDIGSRIGANVRKHGSDVRRRRSSHGIGLRRVRHHDPPRGAVELTSLGFR